MTANSVRIVRNRDLEPFWGVLKAKEPGHMRSLITWMGGPEGYINTNPGVAIESRRSAVGLMDMGPGNRQPGVHVHTMTEIYVIIDGEVESFDGEDRRHIAGPLDCLYIPKGVPHGVRTVGDKPVKLLWVNDDIERWGAAVYLEGPGPHRSDAEVQLIRYRDLEPSWTAPHAKDPGFMRWHASWAGSAATGIDDNAGIAAANANVSISMVTVLAANRLADAPANGDRLHVVIGGVGVVKTAAGNALIGHQDAVLTPAGGTVDLRAHGASPLTLVRIQERAE